MENNINKREFKILKEAKSLVSEYKKLKPVTLKFVIHHEPKNFAMKRPRVGAFKQIYVPDAKLNKKTIRTELKNDLNGIEPVDYPIKISINYYTAIPKNFNKVERLLANKKYIRPVYKPDIDNMEKTYLDALTEVIWVDDCQIVESVQKKYYSDTPRVEIIISYIPFHFSKKQIKKG